MKITCTCCGNDNKSKFFDTEDFIMCMVCGNVSAEIEIEQSDKIIEVDFSTPF